MLNVMRRFIIAFLLAGSLNASSQEIGKKADGQVLYQQTIRPYPFSVIVPVTIAGKDYPFILDTGFTSPVLDRTLERFLGDSGGIGKGQAIGNDLTADFFDAPPMAIGDLKLRDCTAGVLDLSRFKAASGVDIRGIIGLRSFHPYPLWFDFDHETFKFISNVGMLPESMKQTRIHCDTETLYPQITLEIQGKPLDFIIDTGSNEYIGVNHKTFVHLVATGVIEVKDITAKVREEASGPAIVLYGAFIKGELLGINLKNIQVSDTGDINNLGMGFLLNFNFALDLEHDHFYFAQRHTDPPIRYNKMLGAILKFNDGHNHIYALNSEGGAAKDAGLKVWDRVTRLGLLKEADINVISIYELCLHHAGESLDVEVLRPGEEKPIVTQLKLPKKIFEYPPLDSK